jgi:hypothetical protein
VRVCVYGAAGEVWENLKTDGFVESHPNVAKDATLGWGTRLPFESHCSASFRPAAVTVVNVPCVPAFPFGIVTTLPMAKKTPAQANLERGTLEGRSDS